MAENKTLPTDASVQAFIGAIVDEQQRKDCEALLDLLRRITKSEPKMWGPSIIGFGSYHYRYESGREGDMCRTGFSARKKELVVYLVAEGPDQTSLLAQIGKHKMGKSCLYFKRLSDLDIRVLEELIRGSLAELKRRHG